MILLRPSKAEPLPVSDSMLWVENEAPASRAPGVDLATLLADIG